MTDPGTPTFDQLKVFLTVLDVGSFAGAARKLNRATSVISYTITNLESQLGITLFERDSTRRPQLTKEGSALLSETRNVALGFNRLRAKAKGLHQGLEPEVHLAFDMMLPASRVVEALKNFQDAFPTVPLRLRAEALGAVTQLVLDRTSMIGVRGPPDMEIDGLERIGVGSVHLVPVASPNHPLATHINGLGAGRDHVQLVLTDRSTRTAGEDLGVMGTHTWRVADLATKHMLLREGIGWGTMPEPMVREDLACGKLVLLDLPDFKGGHYRFFAIHRTDMPPGPAASFLIEQFERQSHGMNGGTLQAFASAESGQLAATGIQAVAPGAKGNNLHQTAGHGHVLPEVHQLINVGPRVVKEGRRGKAVGDENRGHEPRAIAEQEGDRNNGLDDYPDRQAQLRKRQPD
jgi:DNA-binding transcriptional LysR family regulator